MTKQVTVGGLLHAAFVVVAAIGMVLLASFCNGARAASGDTPVWDFQDYTCNSILREVQSNVSALDAVQTWIVIRGSDCGGGNVVATQAGSPIFDSIAYHTTIVLSGDVSKTEVVNGTCAGGCIGVLATPGDGGGGTGGGTGSGGTSGVTCAVGYPLTLTMEEGAQYGFLFSSILLAAWAAKMAIRALGSTKHVEAAEE